MPATAGLITAYHDLRGRHSLGVCPCGRCGDPCLRHTADPAVNRHGAAPGALVIFPSLLGRVLPASAPLLERLSLLFVPAGVGVIEYLDVLRREWLAIGGAIIVSTVLTMLVTSALLTYLQRPDRGRR